MFINKYEYEIWTVWTTSKPVSKNLTVILQNTTLVIFRFNEDTFNDSFTIIRKNGHVNLYVYCFVQIVFCRRQHFILKKEFKVRSML